MSNFGRKGWGWTYYTPKGTYCRSCHILIGRKPLDDCNLPEHKNYYEKILGLKRQRYLKTRELKPLKTLELKPLKTRELKPLKTRELRSKKPLKTKNKNALHTLRITWTYLDKDGIKNVKVVIELLRRSQAKLVIVINTNKCI